MGMHFDVLIVGAGHGGAQAATTLRQMKFNGTIAIVGEEPHLPYERPPLSKEYLSGEKSFERILIRPAQFWADRQITMLMGERVVAVDAKQGLVATEGNQAIGYGQLIWATGGHARRLGCAGHDLDGVHSVRTRADVDRIVGELRPGLRVAVVGGGYIGLEAAAVLVKVGAAVTVLEAQDRVLARVAGSTLSRFFEAEHRARGVDVRLGAMVEAIEGRDGRATGVRLADGETIAADMVIVGIGIAAAVDPLLEAGAACGNGVAVDARGRTSLPGIWAIGDCALQEAADGKPLRLESVQNATDMAIATARAITGETETPRAVPWFWSNQYNLKLQTVGLSAGHDQEVLRGNPALNSFSIIYLKNGRVIALDCVNATKDFVQGRALVAGNVAVSTTVLADPEIPLKSHAPAARFDG